MKRYANVLSILVRGIFAVADGPAYMKLIADDVSFVGRVVHSRDLSTYWWLALIAIKKYEKEIYPAFSQVVLSLSWRKCLLFNFKIIDSNGNDK